MENYVKFEDPKQPTVRFRLLSDFALLGSQLKSVHFKNTVARSSVHSKLWSFWAEIKTTSADVLLKMIIILSELRIAQLCSLNEWTLLIYRPGRTYGDIGLSPLNLEMFHQAWLTTFDSFTICNVNGLWN